LIPARPQRKPQSTAFTLMAFEDPILQEIDDNFVAIKELTDDNIQAHKIINECLLALGERINKIENILQATVEAVNEMQTVDRVAYKPDNRDEHLTIKENLDYIYERLSKLEDKG